MNGITEPSVCLRLHVDSVYSYWTEGVKPAGNCRPGVTTESVYTSQVDPKTINQGYDKLRS